MQNKRLEKKCFFIQTIKIYLYAQKENNKIKVKAKNDFGLK